MSFGHILHNIGHAAGMILGSPLDTARFDHDHGDKVKHFSYWSNHNAREDATDSRLAAEQHNQTVGQNIDDLRTMFGMYTGPDQAQADESTFQQGEINKNYDHFKQAYLDYFNPQLNDQFATARHNDLFAGVNSGTTGGSADQIRQTGTLNKYVTAEQQLGSKANTARNDLVAGDQQRELGLEDQLQHGGDAAYLMQSGLHSSLASLNSAQDAIAGQTIGDVFNNAGNLYEQGQLAQANGRRGLGIGTPSQSGGLLVGS